MALARGQGAASGRKADFTRRLREDWADYLCFVIAVDLCGSLAYLHHQVDLEAFCRLKEAGPVLREQLATAGFLAFYEEFWQGSAAEHQVDDSFSVMQASPPQPPMRHFLSHKSSHSVTGAGSGAAHPARPQVRGSGVPRPLEKGQCRCQEVHKGKAGTFL